MTEVTTVTLEPRWGVVVNADIAYAEEISAGMAQSGEGSAEGTE